MQWTNLILTLESGSPWQSLNLSRYNHIRNLTSLFPPKWLLKMPKILLVDSSSQLSSKITLMTSNTASKTVKLSLDSSPKLLETSRRKTSQMSWWVSRWWDRSLRNFQKILPPARWPRTTFKESRYGQQSLRTHSLLPRKLLQTPFRTWLRLVKTFPILPLTSKLMITRKQELSLLIFWSRILDQSHS